MADSSTHSKESADHFKRLCAVFDLGRPVGELSAVSGGFHHRMWRLETTAGTFAMKQLAEDLDLRDSVTRERLNATEVAAAAFAAAGIPALASLDRDGEHLQVIDGVGYFVFPWTESRARDRNAISRYHAETVANILARMHRADLSIDGLAEPRSWPLTARRLGDLLAMAQRRNVREVVHVLERRDDILSVVERQGAAQAALSKRAVASHGDLDHMNVLWSRDGSPLLIDWELARPINPTYETLLEALDWSGLAANFDLAPFEVFLAAYVRAGGAIEADDIPPAFDAILGAWINWMLYNVGRAAGIEDARQRAIGTEQIDLAVSALLRLEKNIPRLKDIAVRFAGERPLVLDGV